MNAISLNGMNMSFSERMTFFHKASGVASCAESERYSGQDEAHDVEGREQPSCSYPNRSGYISQHQDRFVRQADAQGYQAG